MPIATVGVTRLKAELDKYLRLARRGRTVTVLHRGKPIARIVPHTGGVALTIRRPAPGGGKPSQIPLPPPLKTDVDVVRLLLEERPR